LLAAIWPAIFVPNSILHIIYILTFFVALVIVSFKVSLSTVSWAFDQPRCALRAYVRRLEDTSPYDDDIEDMPDIAKAISGGLCWWLHHPGQGKITIN
jgi:hypothetical protein